MAGAGPTCRASPGPFTPVRMARRVVITGLGTVCGYGALEVAAPALRVSIPLCALLDLVRGRQREGPEGRAPNTGPFAAAAPPGETASSVAANDRGTVLAFL